ncbi:lytic murein transglycosylase B [Rhodoferax fermentans]|uniref:Lytic murein transglycosylase B n=1 Tax=Rhodoferax fermentans TaxID=28066 RepID=A0A1T1AV75_RHOFE|nr:lytic murein transglycosylase B [Rhodoferax fermentans]MBK1681958.1 lytic murein transglycosylase B [Rhodoferax fermentans]OOV07957.1 lytic murein transglycosylase B [Rhodoferax fermentans]
MPLPALRPLLALLLIAITALPIGAEAKKHPHHPQKTAKTVASAPVPGPSYAQRSDAMQAADEIAQQRDLDPAWVRQAIGQARYIQGIAQAVTPPALGVAKNWQLYRSRFIEPKRIRAGVAFWQLHRDTLLRAQAQTGVPVDIVLGIIGVETIYGQQMGNYRVLDALATLAFDFPQSHPRAGARSQYFKGELAQFLSMMQRGDINPTLWRGSYAGALGLPQFMPSSWHKHAVDFDADGKVDLFSSPGDAIGSVANYLAAFGWQPGQPTHFALSFDSTRLDLPTLLVPDILPTFSVADVQAKGVVLEAAAQSHPGKLALIELQNGDAPPSYLAGTENFYVITRYNWSSYYAMAVIELGQAVIKAAKQLDAATTQEAVLVPLRP